VIVLAVAAGILAGLPPAPPATAPIATSLIPSLLF